MAHRVAISAEDKAALRPWYPDELLDDVCVLRGSFFGWLFGLNGNHAVTINGTVHLTKRAPAEASVSRTVLIGHELFHVEHQASVGWWRFLLYYLCSYRPRHLRSARDHPVRNPGVCARSGDTRAVGGTVE